MADTAQVPAAPSTPTAAPASPPAAAASGDPMDTAFSAFGAALASLSSGSESGPETATPDGQTAGAAARGATTEPAASGAEQSPQARQAQGADATGSAETGQGAEQPATPSKEGEPAKPGPDDEFEAKLREAGLWDAYKRREQSATDKGAARERQRVQREQATAKVTQDHGSALAYITEMDAADRTAFLQSIPDFQAAVTEAGSTVANDFAATLGLDLKRVPPEAFAEALEGRPEKLREAILAHSTHIQDAIRTAHEAGARVSRDQLRAANPLPETGTASGAAVKKPETYEEAMSSFDQALASIGA